MVEFPYETFPIRLEHKDNKDKKVCWFQCKDHFEKYVTRYKIRPNECKVNYRKGYVEIDTKKKKVNKDILSAKKKKERKSQKLFSNIHDFFV